MFRLTKQLELRHCPCSIEFVAAWNVFVVGTYELSDQAGESVNGRFGSLALIAGKSSVNRVHDDDPKDAGDQGDRLILEQECTNGGVFDFCIVQKPMCVQLFAAHSNGNLSSYEIVKLDDVFQINEIASLQTGSAMLTCLNLAEIDAQLLVIVGDSRSTITLIRNQQIIARLRIAKFDYPVWCIKIRFSIAATSISPTDPTSNDPTLVFTGSDDCVLRCFTFEQDFQVHRQLFSVGDEEFAGGVTSIEIVESDEQPEKRIESEKIESQLNESTRFSKTETREEANTSNYSRPFKVLVGSYDERLRIFHCNPAGGDWRPAMMNDQKSTNHRLVGKMSIANAGIWKIKHHRSPCFQLITGMYSGVHLTRDDKLIGSFSELPVDDEKKENELCTESGHLIYGCCFDGDLQRLLVASFYRKTLYCLESDKWRAMLNGEHQS